MTIIKIGEKLERKLNKNRKCKCSNCGTKFKFTLKECDVHRYVYRGCDHRDYFIVCPHCHEKLLAYLER